MNTELSQKKTFKERVIALIRHRATPYLVLFVLIFFLHLLMNMYSSDDRVMRAIEYDSLFSFMVERYLTWSTRIFTDTIFMLLLHAPTILWRVLDSLLYTGFAMALTYLVSARANQKLRYLVLCFFLLYPFVDMVSAGWIVTTCVYLWSAASVAFALVPAKMALVSPDNRLKPQWWVFGILFSFLAGSQEQACCTLIAMAVLMGGWALYQKKFHPIYGVELGIGLVMLGVHLLSPALAIRDVAEAAGWFPDFAQLSFLQKLEMGFSSTMYKHLMEPNWIFLFFAILLTARLFQRKVCPFGRLTALIPLGTSIVFGFGLGYPALAATFPEIAAIRDALGFYGTNPAWGNWESFLPLLFLIANAVCIVIALYLAFEKPEEGLLCIYTLCVGTVVRMVLGFSPTVWASGDRTFIVLYFVFIFLSCRLANAMEQEERPFLSGLLAPLSLVSLMQFVTTLLETNRIGQ